MTFMSQVKHSMCKEHHFLCITAQSYEYIENIPWKNRKKYNKKRYCNKKHGFRSFCTTLNKEIMPIALPSTDYAGLIQLALCNSHLSHPQPSIPLSCACPCRSWFPPSLSASRRGQTSVQTKESQVYLNYPECSQKSSKITWRHSPGGLSAAWRPLHSYSVSTQTGRSPSSSASLCPHDPWRYAPPRRHNVRKARRWRRRAAGSAPRNWCCHSKVR